MTHSSPVLANQPFSKHGFGLVNLLANVSCLFLFFICNMYNVNCSQQMQYGNDVINGDTYGKIFLHEENGCP